MSASIPGELVLFVREIIRALVYIHRLDEPKVSVQQTNAIDLCYQDHDLYCTIGTPEDGMFLFVDTYSTLIPYKDYSGAQAKMLALSIFSHLL